MIYESITTAMPYILVPSNACHVPEFITKDFLNALMITTDANMSITPSSCIGSNTLWRNIYDTRIVSSTPELPNTDISEASIRLIAVKNANEPIA